MKNSNKGKLEALYLVLGSALALLVSAPADAHIRLSSDWGSSFFPDGRLVPEDQDEGARLDKAGLAIVKSRTTTSQDTDLSLELGFKLFFDQTKFYVKPMKFMPQSHPGEVCTAAGKVLDYRCQEGQRHTQACHVALFDENFHEVGWHTVRIGEDAPLFCNAVPAVGVFNADRNQLLVTVQYFFIDTKHATKVSDIGSNWKRMTVLLHLRNDNGHMHIEQDDRCLGNPNRIETIPDARRELKRCEKFDLPQTSKQEQPRAMSAR